MRDRKKRKLEKIGIGKDGARRKGKKKKDGKEEKNGNGLSEGQKICLSRLE